uniref:Uncharacterized protein n=1 Tax=Chlamydomonas leiostraca TaxID=1034604 RepID=A0A7S0WR37_9CHLO|mmetsp:Transcript_23486/g.60086  ORF Transcript_23486/g.60086 Transcript_23486/m.60086 type:complete len:244 (+) Transcript_23486:167-898(+)|eukprot:CAMPEP_0202873076 /NCGR_PEP_ID=MMETSP1391-20130828/22601_1 /ASSEMBLY_ACC=CAM_ASM_000867 /TAXON_ID=1034604 /ORGANISM="Chlamydomonas leiostraca, Strain SAG 11-49" /LENGTH=243 /DNA_ID=CAMNT_0049554243 /DNA_START=89 /DNA_END=820 /DNA_ORIENTATION=+
MADSLEVKILDQLTATPTSFILSNARPPLRSDAARKIDAGFRHQKAVLNPMVYSSDAGLVLYERVVTSHQEDKMLKKLSKPKSVRALVPTSKPVLPHNMSQPSASASSQPQPAASTSGGGAASPKTLSPRAASAPRMNGVDMSGSRAGPGPGPGSSGYGTGLYTPARKQYTKALRSQSDIELAASKQKFQNERSTMTASHVFTWGGRFRFQPPTQAVGVAQGMQQWTPGLQRSPQRLDAFVDD